MVSNLKRFYVTYSFEILEAEDGKDVKWVKWNLFYIGLQTLCQQLWHWGLLHVSVRPEK